MTTLSLVAGLLPATAALAAPSAPAPAFVDLLAVPHRPMAAPAPARRPAVVRPKPAVLVRVVASRPITDRPGRGRRIGVMPSTSRYLHQPMWAWVIETTRDGRFGKVTLPFSGRSRATGWMSLSGLPRSRTPYWVRVDLSMHRVTVMRLGTAIYRTPAATGARASPTPPGMFFVTDRVAIHAGSAFGSFAFGISGLQTHLPPGWGGGNQLAIHGTNSPATIGRSVSAGCVRVSESALAELEPLLVPGTPVVIEP